MCQTPSRSAISSLIPAACAALSLPAAAGVLPEALVHRTLDSGLQVVVLPLDTPGLVAVQTWMDVGSRHEVEEGTTGYAHFFEHLMFHGTPTLSGDARERRLVELAVSENAWTSDDSTCYHLQAPARHLDELLRVEADRFQNLHLEAEGVRREAGAVLGEWRKGRSDPEEQLYYALWDTAFEEHTYSHTPIGLEVDIRAMPEGMDRALAFFETHYRPDHAVLVVAGDVDPEAALASVEAHWGGWTVPEGATERAEPPEEPTQEGLRRRHLAWDGGPTNPLLSVGFRVPPLAPVSEEVAALAVVRELLTSDIAAFRRRVVDEEGLAWGLWSSGPERLDPGLLEVHLQLREGVSPHAVEAVLAEEIAALLDDGQLEEQVALVRDRLRRQALIDLGSPQSWAFTLGWSTQLSGSPEGFERWLEAIASVDAEAVRAAVSTWLRPEGLTVVSLTDAELPPPEDDPWAALGASSAPEGGEASQ